MSKWMDDEETEIEIINNRLESECGIEWREKKALRQLAILTELKLARAVVEKARLPISSDFREFELKNAVKAYEAAKQAAEAGQ